MLKHPPKKKQGNKTDKDKKTTWICNFLILICIIILKKTHTANTDIIKTSEVCTHFTRHNIFFCLIRINPLKLFL